MKSGQKAFTLFEIIIVISILAFVYTLAVPNFSFQRATEVANALGRLNSDVRSAFDLSVLRGTPLRMVFDLNNQTYWLEATDSKTIYLGDEKVIADLSAEEEANQKKEFEERFQEFIGLAEETFNDPSSDKKVVTTSPVIKAKDKLKGPRWYTFTSAEWGLRTLPDMIGIRQGQTAHHERPISREEMGKEAMVHLYFMPSGYVEKAVFYVYYTQGEYEWNENEAPYTITTLPYQGTAEIKSGRIEIDPHTAASEDDEEAGFGGDHDE